MRRRRWTAVVAAIAATTAHGTAGAQAEPPVVARVYVAGAAPQDLGRAQLGGPDTSGDGYASRGTAGAPPLTLSAPPGWSVYRILQVAGVTAAAVDVVSAGGGVGGGDANAYSLAGDDLGATPDFGGQLRPMLWANGEAMNSIRPLRGEDDVNAATLMQGAPGDPLRLYAHAAGALSGVAITVADAGARSKRFGLAGACAGAQVRWEFGDGATSGDASPTHAYATTANYPVVADVECADGTGRAVVGVVGVGGVGAGATPGPGGTATPAPSAAPRASATPKPKATPAPTATRGAGRAKGTTGGRAEATATPGATATPAPSAAATPDATAAPAASATPTPARPAPTAVTPPDASARRRRRSAPKPAPSTLPVVRGRLISAVVPVSAASLAAPRPPAAQSGSGRAPAPAPRIALPLGLLVVAGLLGLGAWRERRVP